jgi:hypothetical protein
MRSFAIIILIVGFALSCTSDSVNNKGMSANVSVLSVAPSPGSTVNARTVLDALVEYDIFDFDSSAEYYLGTLFYSTNNLETFSSSYNSFDDLSRIPAKSGSIRITYPIQKEWESGKLAKPVRVLFYVMVRTAANRTRVIGMSTAIEYPAH